MNTKAKNTQKTDNAAAATQPQATETNKVQVLDPKTGEILSPDQLKTLFRYLPGQPLTIRANMSTGRFNVDGREDLGDTFTFQPIAWRFFNASLFADKKKNMYRDWVEFFFPMEYKGQQVIASIMFHEYSREAFEEAAAGLFYEGTEIWQCQVTAKPVQKTSKQSGNKYYICEFELKKAEDEKQTELYHAWAQLVKPFRASTKTADETTHSWYNYPEPDPESDPADEYTEAETVNHNQ